MKNSAITAYENFDVMVHGQGVAVLNRRGRKLAGILGLAALVAFPHLASAQTVSGGADPATMLVNVATFILGPFGKTLGVLGIVGVGMAWMFGRASLGLVAGVIGGIIIMFGASYLGSTLMGA